MTCQRTGCSNPETNSYQKWATSEQVEYYHSTGDLPMQETQAALIVLVCDTHKLSPAELMTLTHASDCAVPDGDCDCPVRDAPPPVDEGHLA
jgi:hypothetical protein